MDFYDLMKKCRTIRRFDESGEVSGNTLLELVELAGLSPSSANMQPLRFCLVNDRERCNTITGLLGWAGALKEWDGPEEGERPSAFIIIVYDSHITKNPQPDPGIAAHAILLGAAERGLGGCMFGSIQREKLRKFLEIDQQYGISLVVALGIPSEKVVIDQIAAGMDTRYYRDEDDTHHVPKIVLSDLLLNG
ncbi:MAG: nitroreductase family protein [Bacteroidetes bacterium]|nr:nitroreductase family protein [Bacteroidota bacterium]